MRAKAEPVGTRMPVELGQGAAYPSSHGYPLRQSTRGAAHPQSGGTKFTVRDDVQSTYKPFRIGRSRICVQRLRLIGRSHGLGLTTEAL